MNSVASVLMVVVRSLYPVQCLQFDYYYHQFRSSFVPGSPAQPALWRVVLCVSGPVIQAEGSHQPQQPPVAV